ncbi:MAG: Uma2 family endonuclease [Ruminiclostridium sp.]|jgi:Uma2 family endonuclease|nr:Uma2 family endonuclease [Ruminiclostridium sp.]
MVAYQDEPWEELINGEVVLMSPRPVYNHNRIAFNIAHIFENYLKGKRCTVIADGMDLYLSDKDRFVPDTMVVCDPDKLQPKGVFGAPDLVVEVLSPKTAKRDKGYKKDVYGKHGVREYWIVDIPNRSVEQYFLQGETLTLHDIHTILDEVEMDRLTEAERAAYSTSFQCSLYDDLTIHLEDVFSRLI